MSRSQSGRDGLIVGVDGGGTSTRVTLLTTAGECLGYGRSGSGNPTSADPQTAARSVVDALAQALSAAGKSIDDVGRVVAAMAGMAARTDGDWLADALVEAGCRGEVSFESDLLALYFSGTAEHRGYAVVSGTGASAIRVTDGRLDATIDGLGWLLGDQGSGFWIGHQAALAAVSDLDGRGPSTALTRGVLDALQIEPAPPAGNGRPAMLESLMRTIYRHRPVELSRLAPVVFAAAGDELADRILVRAGELLAHTFAAAHRGPGPLIVGGSVLAQPGPLFDTFERLVREQEPAAPITHVDDGVVGAAVLALRRAGVVVDAAGHEALAASVASRRL